MTPLPHHPLAETYPMMDGRQLAELASSIADRGQDVAIVVYQGQVLDGRNRQAACLLAGVAPRYAEYQGPGRLIPSYLEALNEHRRHLSPAWLQQHRARRVERVAGMRRAGKSLRDIADAEGVSESQVRSDLGRATAQGCAVDPPSGKVTGQDGRTRPASRTPPPAEDPGPLADATGHPVPGRLRAAFEDAELAEAAEDAGRLLAVVRAVRWAHPWLDLGEAARLCRRLEALLAGAAPHRVHRPCAGEGCRDCRGSGYLPRGD